MRVGKSNVRSGLLRWAIVILIFGSWAYSLTLPAAYFVRFPGPVPGYDVLLLGWMGIVNFQPAWLANIGLFFVLLIFLHEGRPGGCLLVGGGIVMGLCAIAALFWDSWPQGTNYKTPIVRGPGFYFWIAAVAGTALASLARAATLSKIYRANKIRSFR